MSGPISRSGFARPAGAGPVEDPARRKAVHMVDAVLLGRRWRDVKVSGADVSGRMRLLTRGELSQVRDEIRASLANRGITASSPGVLEGFVEWREEHILRTLAVAVRDADDNPLGSVDDWSMLTDVQLLELWDIYRDFEATLDPFGDQGPDLTEVEFRELLAAAKAGAIGQLMAYGSYKLARFATSTAAPPST